MGNLFFRAIVRFKWWLAAAFGVLLAAGGMWLWRAARRTSAPVPVQTPVERLQPAAAAPVSDAEPPADPVRRWAVPVLLGAVLGLAALLLLLPDTYARWLFVALLALSMGYGVLRLGWIIRAAVAEPVQQALVRSQPLRNQIAAFIREHRSLLSRWLVVLSVVLAVAGAYYVQPSQSRFWVGEVSNLNRGLLLMLLVGLLLWSALRLVGFANGQSAEATAPAHNRINGWLLGAGVLLLAATAEISGQVFHIAQLEAVSPHVQFVLLLAGIGLVVGGLGGVTGTSARHGLAGLDYREVLLLLLLLAGALALRFWRLEDSIRLFVDEINFVNPVTMFWYEDHLPLLQPFSGMIAFPWLYPYMEAQTVALLGRSFTGLRAVSAILGALTVPAVYLLGRALFDRWTGVVAALLLAAFPPHLHFSRIALNNIADPLFGVLAFAFVARGLRSHRWLDFAIGGAALGLTQYFYEGGRLLYPALMVGWLGLEILRRWRRIPWRGLLVAGVAALIVAAPIYYTLAGQHIPFARRMDQVGLNGIYWQELAEQDALDPYIEHLAEALLMFFNLPEGSGFYGGPDAMLLPYLVPFLFLGLFWALYRWRRAGSILLILWMAGTALGNSLLISSNQTTRYVVAFPALVLLVALGLRGSLGLLWPGGPRRPVRWQGVVLVGAACLLLGMQAAYYFGPQLSAFNVEIRRKMDGNDAILRSLDFPPRTQIHIVSDNVFGATYARQMLAFFTDDLAINVLTTEEFTEYYLRVVPRDRDNAFYLEATDSRSLGLLRRLFTLERPRGTPYTDVPPHRQLVLFYAPCCLTGQGFTTPLPDR